ncbi:hypothetical protein KIN20_038159 [Parelaphostrongylus tenuis]|uniref:Mos1 transposase HTH domain-containing protein n=1 Tax=Parelaphostrongylus tenuis TaxID=148309 RepID=A0AAD5RET2_PARTN|nr:hypothetical protein KIN20_038159 [Parelaphostrongylus tenuis]
MESSLEVIPNLLLYPFQLRHNFQAAFDSVNRTKGRRVVCRIAAYEWFTKFRYGDSDLADQPRSERPRKTDREALMEATEEDPTLSTDDLPMISNAQMSRSGRFWRMQTRNGVRAVAFRTTHTSSKSRKKQIAQAHLHRYRRSSSLNRITGVLAELHPDRRRILQLMLFGTFDHSEK